MFNYNLRNILNLKIALKYNSIPILNFNFKTFGYISEPYFFLNSEIEISFFENFSLAIL